LSALQHMQSIIAPIADPQTEMTLNDLLEIDASGPVLNATVTTQRGDGSYNTYRLEAFDKAFSCCTCSRSLRGVVCAHQLLALLEHCLPDASVDEQKDFAIAAIRWLGTTFGALGSCSSTVGVGPFVAAVQLLRRDGTRCTGAVSPRAMPPRSPALAAAAVGMPETPIRPRNVSNSAPQPSPGPTPSSKMVQTGALPSELWPPDCVRGRVTRADGWARVRQGSRCWLTRGLVQESCLRLRRPRS
jgi:hypothetical protein